MSSRSYDPTETHTQMAFPAPTEFPTHAEPTDGSLTTAAADVKDTALAVGGDVARTAKDEAVSVAEEAKFQGRQLLDESVAELRTQAGSAQTKFADTVQSLSDELRALAASPDANGPLTELVEQGRELTERGAAWLRDNDTDQALDQVRRYAARNPWAFLAIAGGTGLLAGRFARGLSGSTNEESARRVLPSEQPRVYDLADTFATSPATQGSDEYPVGEPTPRLAPETRWPGGGLV